MIDDLSKFLNNLSLTFSIILDVEKNFPNSISFYKNFLENKIIPRKRRKGNVFKRPKRRKIYTSIIWTLKKI